MGMINRRTTASTVVAFALAVSACSDAGNQVSAPSFDTTAPPASAPPTSTLPVAPTTSVAVPTTVAATTTIGSATTEAPATSVADDGLTGPVFSDALGVKVTSAPGVTTRGDTRQLLPDGLYVHLAWEADPTTPACSPPNPTTSRSSRPTPTPC